MRLKASSWQLNVDVSTIVDQLLILDARVKPEEALAQMEQAAKDGPLRLVLIDTLAAFFDGDTYTTTSRAAVSCAGYDPSPGFQAGRRSWWRRIR